MKTTFLLFTITLLISGNLSAQPGTLDSSFGVNGKVSTDFFSGTDTILYAKAVALQPDNKIVVAGFFYVYDYHPNFLVARYHPNGDLDSSFGINGKVITYFTRAGLATTYPRTVIILPDGKILVGGYRIDAPLHSPNEKVLSQGINRYSVMARYMPNGNLDSSFGVEGQVQYLIGAVPIFAYGVMAGIAVLKDSSIVTAGYINGLCVIKFHANGTIDSSFASNGQFLDPFSSLHPNDIAIDQEERILIAGYDVLNITPFNDFEIRRLLPSGIYDSTYGNSGIAKTDFFNQKDTANSLIILNNESIVVAGSTDSGNTRKIALAKYDINGITDSSFGINGKTTYSFNSTNISATKLLAQSDGKLIVTGEINDSAFFLGRLESNGAVDVGFGINGVNTTSFGNGALLKSAAIQADGKIICAGRPAFSLARFKGDDDPVMVSIKKKIAVSEGNTSTTTPAKFKIVLNKPATTDVFVNYSTTDLNAIAGSDYSSIFGVLTIKTGKVSGNIVVPVIGDNTKEANERFALVLSNPVNAILGDLDSAICTIKNDDPLLVSNSSTEEDIKTNPSSIKLYPNPAKDVLYLSGLSIDNETRLTIINADAKTLSIYKVNSSTYTLHIKSLPAGTYFLKIESKTSKTILPFIKQ